MAGKARESALNSKMKLRTNGLIEEYKTRWRREWDSNPRYGFPYTRFPSERLQPLGHPSIAASVLKAPAAHCKAGLNAPSASQVTDCLSPAFPVAARHRARCVRRTNATSRAPAR